MAANLTPQYMEAEKKLRAATAPQERLEIMREMLALMPKHKATEKLQAQLKSKIAKLKEEIQKQHSGGKHGISYLIDKQGAGQVVVVGPTNSGKSSLIKTLTGADPEVGDYPFTTRIPAPYMMKFENVKIQLVDLPPITAEYLESWQVELIKVADAALVVADAANPDSPGLLETLFARLKEKKVEFIPETSRPAADEAVRVFHKRILLLANKADLDPSGENRDALKFFFEPQHPLVSISAETGLGLEELRRRIFDLLQVIRAYSKPPGKKIEHDDPHVLKRGANVLDIARSVHKDFAEKLAYARLWRDGQYSGQMVTRDEVLQDQDVVELHL
ncbi:MAG: GTPase [Candidatus Aminicenantales bacterium]